MTLPPAWHEDPIARSHNRKGFNCGQQDLNLFIAQNARQAHQSGAAKTYCAIDSDDGRTIFGYYTLCPGQVDLHHVPLAARPQRSGTYDLSGFRLARLAVAAPFQGQGLGGQLLANAIERCIRVSNVVGGTALLIDAKDDAAVRWYARYGAIPLLDRPLSLVMSYAEYNLARVAAGLPPL